METYEFSRTFDLLKALLLFLIFLGGLSFFLFTSFAYKNKYIFPLFGFSILALINIYLLRFSNLHFPNLIPSFGLMAGPSLLFFIKSALTNLKGFTKDYFYHLILGALLLILLMLQIIDSHTSYLTLMVLAHFGIYLFWSMNILVTKKVIVLRKSTHKNNLSERWLDNFNILLVISVIYISVLIEVLFTTPKVQFIFSIIAMTLGCIFLLLRNFTLNALKGYRMYKSRNDTQKIEKYKDSVLSTQESKHLAHKLQALMESKKLYLNENLNLKLLSIELKTHPKNLSQAINENFNKNFFDFINCYRIEGAKKMLADTTFKDYKIYEIMYEVGFNSRSSFNTAFKKSTGITARQYRERNFEKP
ncbi:MAG: helix-turn-helix domain-containing protein [Saonia sp.]